jgi:hypothetical protein
MQSGNPALNKNTFLDAASGAVVSRVATADDDQRHRQQDRSSC